jgi:hypothetical protein
MEKERLVFVVVGTVWERAPLVMAGIFQLLVESPRCKHIVQTVDGVEASQGRFPRDDYKSNIK